MWVKQTIVTQIQNTQKKKFYTHSLFFPTIKN